MAVYQRERDQRLQWRLAMVNEAGMRIGTTLDIACTAQELADLATENFADLVTVDLLDSVLRGNDSPVSGPPTLRRVAPVNGWVMQPDEDGDLLLREGDREQADDLGHFTGRRHRAAVQRLWNHPAGRCSPM